MQRIRQRVVHGSDLRIAEQGVVARVDVRNAVLGRAGLCTSATRAATAATVTCGTLPAGEMSATGAMRAAPRRPMRSGRSIYEGFHSPRRKRSLDLSGILNEPRVHAHLVCLQRPFDRAGSPSVRPSFWASPRRCGATARCRRSSPRARSRSLRGTRRSVRSASASSSKMRGSRPIHTFGYLSLRAWRRRGRDGQLFSRKLEILRAHLSATYLLYCSVCRFSPVRRILEPDVPWAGCAGVSPILIKPICRA